MFAAAPFAGSCKISQPLVRSTLKPFAFSCVHQCTLFGGQQKSSQIRSFHYERSVFSIRADEASSQVDGSSASVGQSRCGPQEATSVKQLPLVAPPPIQLDTISTAYGKRDESLIGPVGDPADDASPEASPEAAPSSNVLVSLAAMASLGVASTAALSSAGLGTQNAALVSAFIAGYLGIIFEHQLQVNKAAVALLMGVACWALQTPLGADHASSSALAAAISEKLSDVAQIITFLVGAMTIVEVVDAHDGFESITRFISTTYKRQLLWLVGIATFFMSAVLDNLTTTIVMVSLVRNLVSDKDDRLLFGSMIVVAANAGGAWTPIGDVTTTMLWIEGRVTTLPIMTSLFLPSLLSVIAALAIQTPALSGKCERPPSHSIENHTAVNSSESMTVLATGVGALAFVPILKNITGLPPFVGIMAGLSAMWFLTDHMHKTDSPNDARLKVPAALSRIDSAGALFFLGILLAVGALDHAGLLHQLAELLNDNIPSLDLIAAAIGLASAVIDNVPLVAATLGMYDLQQYPPDSRLWNLIAYCAATGGSIFIIGSAAGVALMGLEKVDFMWYAKRVSVSALVGFLVGLGSFVALNSVQLPSLF